MEEIISALELKKQLNELRPIDKEQEAKIMQKFRLDWNYHSNNLEGNSLTYGETKALLLHGITAQGKPLKDHFEVTGHNEAINWVIDVVKGDYPLTESFIRELHKLLLKESYEVDAQTPDGKPTKKRISVGSYKTSANHVQTRTGEMFYFATPEETPAKMGDLMAWYNEKVEEGELNPVLLAAEFHYKFIRIHPFDDGNGRTARILMNFILMKFGYPPVIIKTDDKENYFSALQLADTGNLEAFVGYIAKNLNRSLEIMISGAKGEDIEEANDIDKEIALLEKRLAGHGKEMKAKSTRFMQPIYNENIKLLAKELLSKLAPFQNYYIHKNMVLKVDGTEYPYLTAPTNINFGTRTISIRLDYNTIRRPGLETFFFNCEIFFEFGTVNYHVYEIKNGAKNIFFIKNYDKLDKQEFQELLRIVLKTHNEKLQKALEESSP